MAKQGFGGQSFEEDTGAKFQLLGWRVEKTPVTGDFGVDLVCRIAGEVLVVQCKDYGSAVGVSAVQEVYLGLKHYRATTAAVVARSGFTRAAIKAAESTGVHLLVPSEIKRGCSFDRTQDFQREQEKWAREEARRQIAHRWREYESLLFQYKISWNRWLYGRPLLLIATPILILSTVFTDTMPKPSGDPGLVVLGELIVAALAWNGIRNKPSRPQPPELGRRGAIVICRKCRQKLRVEYGRTGNVRCPRCKAHTRAVT
jgi:hypothetical protein